MKKQQSIIMYPVLLHPYNQEKVVVNQSYDGVLVKFQEDVITNYHDRFYGIVVHTDSNGSPVYSIKILLLDLVQYQHCVPHSIRIDQTRREVEFP
jgi:hypothetical protein